MQDFIWLVFFKQISSPGIFYILFGKDYFINSATMHYYYSSTVFCFFYQDFDRSYISAKLLKGIIYLVCAV